MELTRRVMTNSETGKVPGFGPMNGFNHLRAYPSADLKGVVRPNFDTLYSIAWLDLTNEPMVVSAPDTAWSLLYVADDRHVDGCLRCAGKAHIGHEAAQVWGWQPRRWFPFRNPWTLLMKQE